MRLSGDPVAMMEVFSSQRSCATISPQMWIKSQILLDLTISVIVSGT